jgi:uncharacterized phage protein (TIGR02218 family)
MRTVTTDMNTSLHKAVATLAHTWKFTRKDGFVVRLTDHDQPIKVTGDGVYRSSIGFSPTDAVNSAINFGSQTAELTMAMTDDGFKESDIRAKKWKGSTAVFGVVDWTTPTSVLPVFSGIIGRINWNNRKQLTIEVLGLGNGSVNLANEVYSMTCRHSLGDTGCLVNIEAYRVDYTVVAVTDPATFAVNDLHGKDDGFYALGQLVWDTGNNAGDVGEIQYSLNSTNEVGMFFPAAFPIQLGDTGHLYPGCDLLLATCHDKFDNVGNFDGEPFNVQPRIIPVPASSGSIAGATATSGAHNV